MTMKKSRFKKKNIRVRIFSGRVPAPYGKAWNNRDTEPVPITTVCHAGVKCLFNESARVRE
jgi:hypothetical protein